MKKPSAVIEYHLRELATARDPQSPDHVMPDFHVGDRVVLDIGCGIGQTLMAADVRAPLLVGVDPDQECLVYGRHLFDEIRFVNATAETLPFSDGLFDLVVCRVSLPYTDLRRSLPEIRRVLAKRGRVWFTLHSFSHACRAWLRSVRALNVKGLVIHSYAIVNGVATHILGRPFPLYVPFQAKRYESFQTIGGMTKAMKRHGFEQVSVRHSGKHLICTARKGGPSRS